MLAFGCTCLDGGGSLVGGPAVGPRPPPGSNMSEKHDVGDVGHGQWRRERERRRKQREHALSAYAPTEVRKLSGLARWVLRCKRAGRKVFPYGVFRGRIGLLYLFNLIRYFLPIQSKNSRF